jgi:hypothetical protein
VPLQEHRGVVEVPPVEEAMDLRALVAVSGADRRVLQEAVHVAG